MLEQKTLCQRIQALHTLFHIQGAKFFKKRQLQGHLKQLNLKQGPGHNTRQQDNKLQNRRIF